MFDLSWSELLVIAVVALIAIGPKELPGALRAVGHWMGKVRRMASDFQDQFREAMREADVADLKKQVDEIADAARGYTDYDPLADVDKSWNDKGLDDTDLGKADPGRIADTSASAPSDGTVRNPTSSAAIPPPAATVEAAAPETQRPAAEPKPLEPASLEPASLEPAATAEAPLAPQASEPKPGQGA